MSILQNNYGENQEQGAHWNSSMGRAWVNNDTRMNAQLQIITNNLYKEVKIQKGSKVLDIGCGSGALLPFLSDKVGNSGLVHGVDISNPLLELAKKYHSALENINFLNADAQSYNFKSLNYDNIVSRFGVMFFADPTKAFKNIRKSLKSGGKLNFVCWSKLEDNEFFVLPLQIVLRYLNKPLPTPSKLPGPLSFSEPDHIEHILKRSGFKNVVVKTLKTKMINYDRIDNQIQLFNKIGLAARIKKEASFDNLTIEKIENDLFTELTHRTTSNGTTLKAVVHYVSAKA